MQSFGPIRWDNQQYTPLRASRRDQELESPSKVPTSAAPVRTGNVRDREANSPNGGSADGRQVHCLPLVASRDKTVQDGLVGTQNRGEQIALLRNRRESHIGYPAWQLLLCPVRATIPVARELFQGRILPDDGKVLRADARHAWPAIGCCAWNEKARGVVICDQCRPPSSESQRSERS